jgi:hypothetical protein
MGIWSSTFGGGNSFSESVANTFTPNDGAKYEGGNLVHDGGSNDGKSFTTNTKSHTGDTISGSANTKTNDGTVSSNGTVTAKPKGVAPTFGASDVATSLINPIASLPAVLNKVTSWAIGIDPKENASKDVGGRMVYTKPAADGKPAMSYSYNFLGLPYEVTEIDGKAVDTLSIKTDANGLRAGQDGFDATSAMSGYDRNRSTMQDNGDRDGVRELDQYQQDNSNENGEVTDGRITAEAIREMAENAGVIQNEQDMQDLIDDPNKFLEDRDLVMADLMPSLDANADGTTIDGTDPKYELGENEGFTAVDTGEAALVGDVDQPDAITYDVETNELTDKEMVTAATGTVSDEALVDAEGYTIDIEGAATGINADGTKSVLGDALNDFATQDISTVIDTTTVAGKLLAQKLGEGNYTDAKATVMGQMKIISQEFKDSNGNPVIPPWAQAMHRDAQKSIAFSGISGSAATAAFSNAIMEATLGVAEKDATFFQTLTTKNLDNRQEAVINKANVLSKLEMANMDVRSQAAIQNAKAFMEMDLANLSNEQQAEVINKEALVQQMFDNTKAINAQRLFTAETENDLNKFYSELQVSVERHNTSEINALRKFNTGEINDAAQFNADMKNDRQQFLSTMQYNIDISNAKWRQTVETTNNKNMVDAHTADVKAALDIAQEAQNNLWDSADNLLDYIWKTTDNDMERELRLLTAQMSAQSGQSSGSGLMNGLLTLGGAYLGSSSGSKWLTSLLPSDTRLKENIEHYDTLKGVEFYTWDWNEEGKRIGADQYPSFGVLAQEVQKTHPKAVVEGLDGYLRVNYGMINNDV